MSANSPTRIDRAAVEPSRDVTQERVVVARGYGLRIYVRSGRLLISDGQFADRRTRRLHRVTSGLERLIVIGHNGYVTFDALRWIADVGAAFVQIDSDGRLLTTSIANGPDLAALRRAQALAGGSETGVELARAVLAQKLAGQRAVLDELPHVHNTGDRVDAALSEIREAETLQDLLLAESQAAEAYWGAWASLPIPFPARDHAKLTSHWQTFGQRASLLSKGPRHATNPAGAILNYLYALLEAETTLACHAVGLDPGLGIFHVDQRDRDSLALDLMEAVRPLVDGYVLALLTQRTLAASDFVETRRGACRLKPRLASELTVCAVASRDGAARPARRGDHRVGRGQHSD